MLDEDLLEIVRRNGPVLQGLDRSTRRSPPEQPPAADDPGSSAAALFVEEDEMASWLHYQIDDGDEGRGGLQLLGEAAPTSAAARVAERCGVPRTCERAAARDGKKRKAREGGDPACHTEGFKGGSGRPKPVAYKEADADFESGDRRKDACRSARRTRASEVHNLSERRRRDRINEKMKALQELIPRCNKSDKASMLDEAIEYLKSLQLQVQMLSMGCSMGPMMYPGIQAYSPSMGMGMNMGLGVGIDMSTGIPMGSEMVSGGLGRPMLPFRPIFSGPTIPGPRCVNFGARPYMPLFHPSNVMTVDQLRAQASNQQDAVLNSVRLQDSNMVRLQDVMDLCHPYANPRDLHTLPQSRSIPESGTSTDICNIKKSK